MNATRLYLVLYNVVQCIGWSVILLKTLWGLSSGAKFSDLYLDSELELKLFQTTAVLEILHAMAGIVRSPVGTTTMQVFSRVSILWLVLHTVNESRSSIGVPMLLVAWSLTEVIRYSFYALNLLNYVPQCLLWMRYTFFILLYPMGASGELLTVFAALPEVAQKKHLTIEMPNFCNMGFSFWWFLVCFSLIYVPGFPQMYLYMFGQRKKVLCTEARKKTE
ncbi:hypothetical protein AB6A40_009380 [Gnathostoma spinigerum]|uniref:Very-long-chain (3R)-3-hydroxyacyl-CoA dehydratase n=1 Tax=Gnathostoma spinigerum TaxID=75299 RepID=A0ABD6ES47_9BILA